MTRKATMTREDLLKEYEGKTGVLTAVLETTAHTREGEVGIFRFTLDGKTYTAEEDPNDGYRSYCEDFEVDDEPLRHAFDCEVRLECHLEDVLEFVDVKTNKVVLEVGTDYSDDYYPFCVQRFDPRNMAVNNP